MDIIKNGDLSFIKERQIEESQAIQETVNEIIKEVKRDGDKAVHSFTEQFDGAKLESFRVQKADIDAAYDDVPESIVTAIKKAAENIYSFHKKQGSQSWQEEDDDGSVLGQRLTPLDAVGVYAPGGTAAYPSTVLMGCIPAIAAGVRRVVLVSPPGKNGDIPAGVLVAAREAGVSEIYKIGGAQAIAALAYGTETIEPVDKIVGPGNLYVALAKKAVFGHVDIDSIAGPSEIVILADESAHADFIAADLLSQAEHDVMSMAVLITTSEILANQVQSEVNQQLQSLPRFDIASEAMKRYGKTLLVNDLNEGIDRVNQLAPEHLEVMTRESEKTAEDITNAGAIFLGTWSTEPVGDYIAGPNHILPTHGTARFASPLTSEDFIKKTSIISYSRRALGKNAESITDLARYEGLEAHARAVEIRIKGNESDGAISDNKASNK